MVSAGANVVVTFGKYVVVMVLWTSSMLGWMSNMVLLCVDVVMAVVVPMDMRTLCEMMCKLCI